MVLTFLALGTYCLLNVPPNERTLANVEKKFEEKFTHVQRLLGGAIEKENKDLTLQLAEEKKKEAGLRTEEHDLEKKLSQARNFDNELEHKLGVKESSFKAAEKDATKARQGLQNWQHTSTQLKSQLALVQKDAVQKHRDLQKSLREASVEKQHAHNLESSLVGARKQIASLEAAEKRLTSQLRKEENWHQDTVQKFRRFRNAEQALMQSIDVDSKSLPMSK
jgi:chromosome segregation ATPase